MVCSPNLMVVDLPSAWECGTIINYESLFLSARFAHVVVMSAEEVSQVQHQLGMN